MVIRLPDGRGFLLRYPQALGLARFDLRMNASVSNQGAIPVYAKPTSLFFGSPVATYRGVDGRTVRYYEGIQAASQYSDWALNYLVYRFGNWTVLVEDIAHRNPYQIPMTKRQRETWARSFNARLTKGGYLLFTPLRPLRVQRGRFDVTLRGDRSLIEIGGPTSCSPTTTSPRQIPLGEWWCSQNAGASVSVTGDQSLVHAATSGLTILRLPPLDPKREP